MKKSEYQYAAILIIGTVLELTSYLGEPRWAQIMIGKVIVGISSGIGALEAVGYLSEISPTAVRGATVALSTLSYSECLQHEITGFEAERVSHRRNGRILDAAWLGEKYDESHSLSSCEASDQRDRLSAHPSSAFNSSCPSSLLPSTFTSPRVPDGFWLKGNEIMLRETCDG